MHHEYGHLSPWVSVAGYGVAALTAVKRESNLKWMLFTAVYTTSVAWVAAFLVRVVSMVGG